RPGPRRAGSRNADHARPSTATPSFWCPPALTSRLHGQKDVKPVVLQLHELLSHALDTVPGIAPALRGRPPENRIAAHLDSASGQNRSIDQRRALAAEAAGDDDERLDVLAQQVLPDLEGGVHADGFHLADRKHLP